jgi:tetratricopeptide (TPR) repeat protein
VQYAQLLVELGELSEAEREVTDLLDAHPEDLTGVNLLAKIKHVRGELSQAVALWAQIHASSPHNERALMYLGSILQLARDPERGAGEYLALGPGQLVHKPTAHLQLEAAFHAFLARRVDEAYTICERLAHRWRTQDPMLYKLAVLARAWIAELSGDLEVACTTLEALGNERGFETDTDRVLALARVYERVGTRDRLEKAAHVFRFLERSYGKMSALPRLARIYRRLGDVERAEVYDRRWLDSFEQRMHRPTLGDVVRVAAGRYVPLEWLARLGDAASARAQLERAGIAREGAPHASEKEGVSGRMQTREQALGAFLAGDARSARRLFTPTGAGPLDLLDETYLAELDVLEGSAVSAASRFARVLDPASPDRRIVGVLLRAYERTGAPELRAVASRALAGRSIAHDIEAQLRATPLRADVWREMATLRSVLGDGEEAARYSERAHALSEAAQRDARPVGRVLAAAVYQFVGKTKGLIHQVWADRRPVAAGRGGFLASDDILGNVTFEMKQHVRNTFFAVREYARSRFPQQTSDIFDYQYTYKVTKEDEPSGGPSAGLPTALAFLSVFLQRPVPQDVAFTGVLIADSHDALVVRSVGDAAYKVKGAYHRNLRRMVMPAENRADLTASAQVPAAVVERFVRYVTTLDDAVTVTFGEEAWM